jgi:hypothetical protein
MPIIVNLDVMMAKRKMSLNELSVKVELPFQSLHPKNRESESHPLQHLRGNLPGFGLPTWRYPGICR